MNREQVCHECVRAMIANLENAPNSAAREVARVWTWAFSRLEEHPEDFNSLQDSNPKGQRMLVEEFLKTCERRAISQNASDQRSPRDEKVSDTQLVKVAIEGSLSIKDAPRSKQISQEIADALAAFGMFLAHEGHNAIDSPSRFAYGAALFGLQEQVFSDILQSKKIPHAQRKILSEVASCLPKGDPHREYFRRCEAAAHFERHFGFSKMLLSATDVYQRGLEFYQLASKHGPALTLTFSNTSGLWNPLERQGTAEFLRRYGVAGGSEVKFKDGFRSTNFVDGILNPSWACRRLYFFNEQETWQGFHNARQAATNTTAFDADADGFADEVVARMESSVGTLHLVAVKNWEAFRPLSLVTRVSHETLMFSNRGSDLSISHAFWCRLSEAGKRRADRIGKAINIVHSVTDMVSGGLLSVLASLGPFLEEILGKRVENVKEIIAGERMRRLLDQEPAQVIEDIEDKFGLALEYITPTLLRKQMKNAMEKDEKAPTTAST